MKGSGGCKEKQLSLNPVPALSSYVAPAGKFLSLNPLFLLLKTATFTGRLSAPGNTRETPGRCPTTATVTTAARYRLHGRRPECRTEAKPAGCPGARPQDGPYDRAFAAQPSRHGRGLHLHPLKTKENLTSETVVKTVKWENSQR